MIINEIAFLIILFFCSSQFCQFGGWWRLRLFLYTRNSRRVYQLRQGKIFKTLTNGFIRLYLATDTNFLDFFRRCIHGWPAFARTTRVVRTAGPIVGLRSWNPDSTAPCPAISRSTLTKYVSFSPPTPVFRGAIYIFQSVWCKVSLFSGPHESSVAPLPPSTISWRLIIVA